MLFGKRKGQKRDSLRGGGPLISAVDARKAPSSLTGTACGRHPVASLLSMREGFPLKLPFTSLLFLPVSQNGAQAFFASTILAQRSDLRKPVRCGPVPIRQAVVPAARSACMDTPPSRGPTGHSHCILHRPRLPCFPDSRPARGNARRQPRCPKTGPPYATG